MAISPLDSVLYSGLFGDAEVASLLSDEAELAAMVEMEIALARVQGRLGIIPNGAAKSLEKSLAGTVLHPDGILSGTAGAGVPVPALVAKLRELSEAYGANYLHYGATSQDVVDTGLMLRVKRILGLFEHRLEKIIRRLTDLAKAHRATPMAARTRAQMATPISYGLRTATSARDLAGELKRLRGIMKTGLFLQLGGASGDLAAMAIDPAKQIKLTEDLARELGLSPAAPWMTGRRHLLDIATLFNGISTALGKIGMDVIIGTRTEVGELILAEAGGSSTMPQKRNPVKAEILVALARQNAALLGAFAATGVHAEERDGISWMGEWLTLPQMAAATGASLLRAQELVAGLEPDVARMRQAINDSNGLMLAEAVSFALMDHMSRFDAQSLVKQAAMATRAADSDLIDEIAKLTDVAVDWAAIRATGESGAAAANMTMRLIDEIHAILKS